MARKMARKRGKQERKEIERDFYAEQRACIDRVEEEREMLFDLQIIFITAAHELFGFGEARITRLATRVMEIGEVIRAYGDDAYEDLRGQLALETKYDLSTKTTRGDAAFRMRKRTVDRISLLYLWVLHDDFGFGRRRLTAMYHQCALLATENDKGTRTIEDMLEVWKKRGFDFRLRKVA